MGEEIFIDANIFLEIFFDDAKAEVCEKFLKSLNADEKIGYTSDFLIYACIIVMENKYKDTKRMENALIFFKNCPNLKIVRPSFDELNYAIEISKIEKLDFDDSLVVACMRNYGIKGLASLDRHFDKVKGIEKVKI
ncbi:MAG TPA: type II toxin-antitoxin system VapC family toxin [Candidatus Nanoarchaeia archaeon]|nr:type II toxin-antitoxin system VapC family toxin [Candidatus Nanoarchaeia archaeon]